MTSEAEGRLATRRLGAVAALLAASVALSRVLGYGREAVIAWRLGVSSDVDAYRAAFVRLGTLVRALAVAAVVWAALSLTVFLLPVAIWLAGRWCLLAQVVVLESEKRSGIGTVRRSAELVRGHWFRVASLVVVGGALALVAGPLVGALLIILTEAPLALLNVVAGVMYAIAMPFVALTTSYVYFDCRGRHELEPAEVVDELPAEISLAAR